METPEEAEARLLAVAEIQLIDVLLSVKRASARFYDAKRWADVERLAKVCETIKAASAAVRAEAQRYPSADAPHNVVEPRRPR